MAVRSGQGLWRLSASGYKLALTTHIILSVAWLGVVVAKIGLGLAAYLGEPGISAALYPTFRTIDWIFPPAAIGTLLSGIVLGLGTRWGLVQHYWVAVKLVLTVAIPATAVQIGGRLMTPALSVSSPGLTLLMWLFVAHALMLAAATVLSVYKPWGLTPFGRRQTEQKARGSSRYLAPTAR